MSQVLPSIGIVPHQCDDAEQHRRRAKNDPSIQWSPHGEKARLPSSAASRIVSGIRAIIQLNRLPGAFRGGTKAGAELPRSKVLLRLAEGLEVDSELLALFVEVAAFEAEDAGDVGHVEIVAADFGEEHFPFERFGAFHQRSRTGAS